jgi:hypothetical protein
VPRLLSPDDKCIDVEVPVGRARNYAGTTISVSDPQHLRALRAVGYTVADIAGAPARARGFTCGECGFVSFFRTCGRCGHRIDGEGN